MPGGVLLLTGSDHHDRYVRACANERRSCGRQVQNVFVMRRASVWVALVVVIVALGLSATRDRASVRSTDPVDSSTVTSPARVNVTFDRAVDSELSSLRLFGASGEEIRFTRSQIGGQGQNERGLRIDLIDTQLPAGRYTASWQAISIVGQPSAGTFSFHVADGSQSQPNVGDSARQRVDPKPTNGVAVGLLGIARDLIGLALAGAVWWWSRRRSIADRGISQVRASWLVLVMGCLAITSIAVSGVWLAFVDHHVEGGLGELLTARVGISATLQAAVGISLLLTIVRAGSTWISTVGLQVAMLAGSLALLHAPTSPGALDILQSLVQLSIAIAAAGSTGIALVASREASERAWADSFSRAHRKAVALLAPMLVACVATSLAIAVIVGGELGSNHSFFAVAVIAAAVVLRLEARVDSIPPDRQLLGAPQETSPSRLSRTRLWERLINARSASRLSKRRSFSPMLPVSLVVLVASVGMLRTSPSSEGSSDPFVARATTADYVLDVVIEPFDRGPNAVHLYVLEPNGLPADVTDVRAVIEAPKGVATNLSVHHLGRGHFVAYEALISGQSELLEVSIPLEGGESELVEFPLDVG